MQLARCTGRKTGGVQVFREVAVLDKINPGGFYSSRIKLLGSFQPPAASRAATADSDIPDPLYGDLEGADLLACIARLHLACRGLMGHLLQLQARCAVFCWCKNILRVGECPPLGGGGGGGRDGVQCIRLAIKA